MKIKVSRFQIDKMLHSLGISYISNGEKIKPNKRYSPYPSSYRNYYQISQCDDLDYLVEIGFAFFKKGEKGWQDCYFITKKGKDYLKQIGYKWKEE